ncbi:hypothetical protein SteCoe_18218 [Stentor coeruleus]|uniref:Uncharacterized protein n=1 Tax=Stentor coeruleus TaxID=5963 RepID=A0A1R2BXE3_9CILI|nr:hypothetical protein SteCoe_18218 [Stentor coeruleus]
MQNFANFIPEITVKRYKLKFTGSLKQKIKEAYNNALKSIKNEMKLAISTIESYEKSLENAINDISNSLPIPISKGFCDQLCFKCNSTGLYFINNVGYHKACLNCIGLLESIEICMHCQSKVNINISEPLNMCKGCNKYPQIFQDVCIEYHCLNCFYFCKLCNEIHCKVCSKVGNKLNAHDKRKEKSCNNFLKIQQKRCDDIISKKIFNKPRNFILKIESEIKLKKNPNNKIEKNNLNLICRRSASALKKKSKFE